METERWSMEPREPRNGGDVDDLIFSELDYQVSQR